MSPKSRWSQVLQPSRHGMIGLGEDEMMRNSRYGDFWPLRFLPSRKTLLWASSAKSPRSMTKGEWFKDREKTITKNNQSVSAAAPTPYVEYHKDLLTGGLVPLSRDWWKGKAIYREVLFGADMCTVIKRLFICLLDFDVANVFLFLPFRKLSLARKGVSSPSRRTIWKWISLFLLRYWKR